MYFDWRLWALTAGVRGRIAASVLVGLAAVAAGIARLALLGWLLGRVLAGESLSSLAPAIALTAVALVVRSVLDYARAMVAHHTAARVQTRLRQTLYTHVADLGPAHFARGRTGDVLLSLVEGVQQLEVYFGQYLPQLFVAALTPFLIFAFVVFLDFPVALVLLAAAVVILLAPTLWHRWDSEASLARNRAYAAYGADFLDAVQGLATLKAFGQSTARARQLDERARDLFRSTMWVLGTNTLARGITDTGIAVGAAAALALGAWRVSTGSMSLASLLVILMLGVEVFRPLRELRVLLHQGMLGRAAARGIFTLLDARPAVRDRVPGPEPIDASLAFEDVTFEYPGGGLPAHVGLRFSVSPGERVGIVGPSGSGKSTIARLLLRFHDPGRGRVTVGGCDLRELSLEQLRGRIAVVNQDTWLFHGTVEENIRMGRPTARPDELRDAARAANAEEFIARLPQGYATVVGERGVRLSGGQRQRIAIARALLRDAPILVLDEALSSVDAESEALIQGALDRLMQGRTTLVFAHRLSSVIGADRILVLDEGRLVEQGTHTGLLARGGVYAGCDGGRQSGSSRPCPRSPERSRNRVPHRTNSAEQHSMTSEGFMSTYGYSLRQWLLPGMAVTLLLSGCAPMKVPIKDPVPSAAAYVKPTESPPVTLFFRDARSSENKKQPTTGRVPMHLTSPGDTPFEPVTWLAGHTVKELVARGLPARLADDASGAQTVVIRVFQIENRRDSGFSPLKTFTRFSADVTTGKGTQRIATFIMRRKVPVWTFDEVIDPTYNDPMHLLAKELAAKLNQLLFDAKLSDGQVDEVIARTTGSTVSFRDVYELGFGNNARAIPQLVNLSTNKEGDIVRAALSSLGVLRASQHFDRLVKEAESTDNDWEDRAVALKAIGDLGTPQSRAYLEKRRGGLGPLTDSGAARTNALIGLYLD